MSFTSGTVASSATPAKALVDLIKTQLNAHAAYSFVEDVTSGTITATVYKCLGSVNSHGVDFYIVFHRTSDAATLVTMALCESYNSTTHVMTGQVPTLSMANASATPDANGYHTTTNTLPNLSNAYSSIGINVNTVTFNYFISSSNDRVVLSTLSSGTPTGGYAGGYERLYTSTQDPAPLYLGTLSQQTSIGSGAPPGFTREITSASAVTNLWKAYQGFAVNALGPHSIANQDVVQAKYPAVKMLVGSATIASRANARGLLRDILHCDLSVTAINGDTITVDGETYTCVSNTAGSTNGNMLVRNAA